MAGVTAGLQVGPKVFEPECAGALLKAAIAAVIDRKPARKDQPTGRFCWLWACPCVAGLAGDRHP